MTKGIVDMLGSAGGIDELRDALKDRYGVEATDGQLAKIDGAKTNVQAIAAVLSAIVGKPLCRRVIKGSCQGEVDTLIVPEGTPDSLVDYFEAVWFGTGSQVEVSEDGGE
jgi:hypothetical protein